MNLPNKLTVSRLFATVIFVLLMVSELPYTKLAALIVFVLACITDWIDGKLARMFNIHTDFGKLMDPLADKILISSAFITFIERPEVALPSWCVIIIISREFAITGLRLLAASDGKIIPAGFWGKNKTISQIVAIITILVYLTSIELSLNTGWYAVPDWMNALFTYLILIVMIATVFLTVMSGIMYLAKSWHILKEM
ncbi:MAG: CDP-diacylglycerol--glycerol-3-phosphate 3-phosphatidyltransferase [Candidatus Auribacter fodinae]|uniref:CDP-diacylglycerol--glycerol-3-phosphate 3-phosphatidyltransferase n=1 Tax=Candidatus Auribacter fodinae TaxID=2093366 RepID=A0A3A4QYE0_9BACT|nr:MAG: CDP-diacylglycerol--glycerol-3-phosphate 3-phosphatidyltransferase [Candidatus Auribacter fodinae]